VLGEDKKRLSKRHAATSLNSYKEMGFTKETIINALALLGWSTENEIFSMNELIESFNLKNVQKGAAVFDLKRFNWVSSQQLSKLNDDDFCEAIKPFMKVEGINDNAPNYKKILLAMRTSKTNLREIAQATRPFFYELEGYDEKGVNKFLNESLETLTFALEQLSNLSEWNETELDMVLINVRDYFNLPIPKVNQPMRIALVGSTVSPSLGLTLELFGKEKSLERIEKAIDFIS
jgi:glutamyl-tRNA synthetase